MAVMPMLRQLKNMAKKSLMGGNCFQRNTEIQRRRMISLSMSRTKMLIETVGTINVNNVIVCEIRPKQSRYRRASNVSIRTTMLSNANIPINWLRMVLFCGSPPNLSKCQIQPKSPQPKTIMRTVSAIIATLKMR